MVTYTSDSLTADLRKWKFCGTSVLVTASFLALNDDVPIFGIDVHRHYFVGAFSNVTDTLDSSQLMHLLCTVGKL